MKILTLVFMLFLALNSFASSETKTFFFDGSQDSVQMSLRAEETHTEYRYEQRQTICYRQIVHHETICHTNPQGQTSCRTVPRYVTVPYSCIQTVQIPYEVKDFDVIANVNLKVSTVVGLTPGETFKVKLDEDSISLSGTGSKKFFLIQKMNNVNMRVNGSVKFIDANYSVDLVEAASVVKALEVSDVSLKDTILSFKTGSIEVRSLIGFHLNVKKAPVFGSDTVLFDRELSSSEIEISSQAEATTADVNIRKLGVELGSGRFTLTAKTFFKYQGTILNVNQFDRIEASRTLIYKNR
jgi:hypothetical protein